MLEILLNGGLDPNRTDRFGNSAAYYAIKHKYEIH